MVRKQIILSPYTRLKVSFGTEFFGIPPIDVDHGLNTRRGNGSYSLCALFSFIMDRSSGFPLFSSVTFSNDFHSLYSFIVVRPISPYLHDRSRFHLHPFSLREGRGADLDFTDLIRLKIVDLVEDLARRLVGAKVWYLSSGE